VKPTASSRPVHPPHGDGPAAARLWRRLTPASLRWQLLAGIVLPVAIFLSIDAWTTYQRLLGAINTAYDRSLLASARSIGELIEPDGDQLRVQVPFAALDIFEADNAGRMYYRILGLRGEVVSGHADLPAYTRTPPQRSAYAALVDFYDGDYRGERVRIAALYQPVAGARLRGVALVQVAETREIRERAALTLLYETLVRHVAMLLAVGLVVAVVVARALQPVQALRLALARRDAADLSPIRMADDGRHLPSELQQVPAAINDLMQRLAALIRHQRQFVRDASHQLRTPLAVLKAQAQNGLSGHADALATLGQMHGTVDRAIHLANQMLALAKLEQVALQDDQSVVDLAEVAREVALDLAPLIAARELDFELRADQPVHVAGHAWMLRELLRNLVHNAVRATPPGGLLLLVAGQPGDRPAPPPGEPVPPGAWLLVRDSGPGLADELRLRLFEPFHAGTAGGSGLGLAFCKQVCVHLGAELELINRTPAGTGLDAWVRLRLAAAGVTAAPDNPRPPAEPGYPHVAQTPNA
jgi:two-component system sensor histidine kinase TctE